jgi:adenylate cyclase
MPFDSLNDDPAQKHFGNGITEDVIAGLSRFHDLSVRAPSASSALWDKTIDVRRMGRELGVQYVVEGSVRRFGDRVRIASKLVEASRVTISGLSTSTAISRIFLPFKTTSLARSSVLSLDG